jgi:hypothetical protein
MGLSAHPKGMKTASAQRLLSMEASPSRSHPLLRPGGPTRQTSAQPGRAGTQVQNIAERRRCGTARARLSWKCFSTEESWACSPPKEMKNGFDSATAINRKRHPSLCHPERSRGTCSSADLSWRSFSTERSLVESLPLAKSNRAGCSVITQNYASGSRFDPHQLGHASGLIPVRHVDVGVLIDVASMGCAEICRGDIAGKQFVVCPLILVWIIP